MEQCSADNQTRIEVEIRSIQAQIGSLEEASQPVEPSVSLGRLTRMEAIQSKSVSEATLAENQNRLVKLQAALKRLSEGTYTTCVSCGKQISKARLEYIPETEHCINCA